jgi:hypothetical protein
LNATRRVDPAMWLVGSTGLANIVISSLVLGLGLGSVAYFVIVPLAAILTIREDDTVTPSSSRSERLLDCRSSYWSCQRFPRRSLTRAGNRSRLSETSQALCCSRLSSLSLCSTDVEWTRLRQILSWSMNDLKCCS